MLTFLPVEPDLSFFSFFSGERPKENRKRAKNPNQNQMPETKCCHRKFTSIARTDGRTETCVGYRGNDNDNDNDKTPAILGDIDRQRNILRVRNGAVWGSGHSTPPGLWTVPLFRESSTRPRAWLRLRLLLRLVFAVGYWALDLILSKYKK